jgi:pyruvate formate lyase activating enzyme
MEGLVFDIRRFTIHDGPGIRSTVFLKGCPLDCAWCQNPEGKETRINLWYFADRCIGCYQCLALCPRQALAAGNTGAPLITIDRNRCDRCGECVRACPAKALAFDARTMSVATVVNELLQDRIFYETSGGGITISGGDPLCQYRFALEILKQCRTEKIDTAIETCLYAEWAIIEEFIAVTGLLIVDLKLMNSALHLRYTGKSNELVKGNLEKLVQKGAPLLIRVPLIPQVTATVENLTDIARFIHGLGQDLPVELMNYNPLGINKYRLMGIPYPLDERAEVFSPKSMEEFKLILRTGGIPKIVED